MVRELRQERNVWYGGGNHVLLGRETASELG
jgi:hypothetical protein